MSKGLEPRDILLIAVVASAIIGALIKTYQIQIDNTTNFFHSLLPSSQNWKIYFLIVLPFILFFNYKINVWVRDKLNKHEHGKELFKIDSERINELLEYELKSWYSSDEVRAHVDDLNGMLKHVKGDKRFNHHYSKLKEKMDESEERLVELEKEDEKNRLRDVKRELEDEIKSLEEEKRKKEWEKEQLDDKKLRAMNVSDNPVFIKKDLSKAQIDLLLGNGYSYLNEHCIDHGKIIQVLVKPTLNHTKTHTFLVWSVKRFLNKMKEVSHVQDFDTVGADITFKCNDEKFAVEIETGTLLSKKFQLSQKIDSLNEKYKDRWMFVVSNKNLLSKYRKFGVATTRSEFQKTVKNMLKIATQ